VRVRGKLLKGNPQKNALGVCVFVVAGEKKGGSPGILEINLDEGSCDNQHHYTNTGERITHFINSQSFPEQQQQQLFFMEEERCL
jgi:hypothetical protein